MRGKNGEREGRECDREGEYERKRGSIGQALLLAINTSTEIINEIVDDLWHLPRRAIGGMNLLR